MLVVMILIRFDETAHMLDAKWANVKIIPHLQTKYNFMLSSTSEVLLLQTSHVERINIFKTKTNFKYIHFRLVLNSNKKVLESFSIVQFVSLLINLIVCNSNKSSVNIVSNFCSVCHVPSVIAF